MDTTPSPSAMNNAATATLMEQVLYEVKRVVVGQDRFLERVMVAMLARATCWSRVCPAWPRRSQ